MWSCDHAQISPQIIVTHGEIVLDRNRECSCVNMLPLWSEIECKLLRVWLCEGVSICIRLQLESCWTSMSTSDHVLMWPCSSFTIYQSDTWRDCPRNRNGVVQECLHFKKWNNISFKINFSEYGSVKVCLYVHKSGVLEFLINLRHVHLWPCGHMTMFKSHHKSKWHMEILLYVEVDGGAVWECLHLDLRSILIYINPRKIWIEEDRNQKKKERRGVQNESCSKKRNEMHEPTTMHYNAIYVRNNFQERNFLIGTLLMYILNRDNSHANIAKKHIAQKVT